MAGAMASEVATMQPAMMAKPARSASAAIASASVSPPALSSLMLTASYLPASAGNEATVVHALVGADRDRPLDGGQRLVAALRQRLLHQHHAGWRAGGEIGGEVALVPALIGIDDQGGLGRGGAHRGDAGGIAAMIVIAAELDLEQRAAGGPWRRPWPSRPGSRARS